MIITAVPIIINFIALYCLEQTVAVGESPKRGTLMLRSDVSLETVRLTVLLAGRAL